MPRNRNSREVRCHPEDATLACPDCGTPMCWQDEVRPGKVVTMYCEQNHEHYAYRVKGVWTLEISDELQ